MSEVQRWNKQAGMLWMERDGLRLVVHLPPAKGYVRFAVIDHGGSDRHPDRLIGSGTFEGRWNSKGCSRQNGRTPCDGLSSSDLIGDRRPAGGEVSP
jgi:hypothetical protein